MALSNIKSSSGVSVVVAAVDSLHPERADFICDGTADQVTIQAAIHEAAGKDVSFLDGTYDFSGYIETEHAGLTLSGFNAEFFLHAATNGQLIQIKHDDFSIKGITLDGNGGNQTSGNGIIEAVSNVENIDIGNVHFKRAWCCGFYANGSVGNPRVNGFNLYGCIAEDFYNGISHVSSIAYLAYCKNIQMHNIKIDNFTSNTNPADGIKVIYSNNIDISNILIHDITGHGIFVGYGSKDANVSNINFHLDNVYGLEAVCIEFAGDGTHTGTDKNERVHVSNANYLSNFGGNNGHYFSACDAMSVIGCSVKVDTTAMDNCGYHIEYVTNSDFVGCSYKGLLGEDTSAFRANHSEDLNFVSCRTFDSPIWAWGTRPRACFEATASSSNIKFVDCVSKNVAALAVRIGTNSTAITGNTIEQLLDNRRAIEVVSTHDNCIISNNEIKVGAGSAYGGIYLWGTNDNCVIMDNILDSGLSTAVSIGAGITNLTLRDNIGFATEVSGTATIANGTTSIVVTHGLAVTPAAGDIVVTPTTTWGSMTQFYIDTYTSTQFTIHSDADPTQDVGFLWKAVVL